MQASDMTTKTVGGLLAYCDWLKDKGYQSPNAVEAWKTAVKKVFATVEPDAYEAISLSELDLNDYVRRFRTLAGAQYKAETISVYEKRIVNAMEAHEYYITNGKPPAFRSPSSRVRASSGESEKKGATSTRKPSPKPVSVAPLPPEKYEFNYPMSYGMAYVSVPMRMTRRDIERLTTVLSTLEETPQIPEQVGKRMAA
jgi:hypothetical protein